MLLFCPHLSINVAKQDIFPSNIQLKEIVESKLNFLRRLQFSQLGTWAWGWHQEVLNWQIELTKLKETNSAQIRQRWMRQSGKDLEGGGGWEVRANLKTVEHDYHLLCLKSHWEFSGFNFLTFLTLLSATPLEPASDILIIGGWKRRNWRHTVIG